MSDKKLLIKLAADVEGLKRGLRDASKQVDAFSGQVQKIGAVIAGAFSVKAIGEFVFNISKLAGEAKGVREAFDRLPQSIKLMNDLKAATGGTVDELQLMKRSVMASNFDISLKELPKLLEFATLRAKQTGQSVDYLVDSIVTGIGRKSKLILDNLGISAVQLTEALGGASAASSSIAQVTEAVGKIIDKNLPQMGKLSENAATKIDRLKASWINLQIAMGDAANGTGILGSATSALSSQMDILASKNLSFAEKLGSLLNPAMAANAQIKDFISNLKNLNVEQNQTNDALDTARYFLSRFGNDFKQARQAVKGAIDERRVLQALDKLQIEQDKKKADSIRNEKNLTELLNALREEATLSIGKERSAINLQIQAIENEIAALQKLGLEKKKVWVGDGPAAKTTGMGSGPMLNPNRVITELGSGPAFDEDNWEKTRDEMEKTARVAAQVGDVIGQSFGDMITGAQSFSQAMMQAVGEAVNALERYVLAQMIANSAKFGPLGIVAAAVGFGVVKSLFRNIGKSSTTAPSKNYGGMSVMASSARIQVHGELVQRGSDLVYALSNTDRQYGRYKTTS